MLIVSDYGEDGILMFIQSLHKFMYTLLKEKKPKKYPIYRKGVAATIFQSLLLTFCQYNIADISKNGNELPNIVGAC